MPFDGSFHVQHAHESVIVLDELERLLNGGRNWTRGVLRDGDKFCTVGGLRYIRALRKPLRDRAGVYISRAIRELYLGKLSIWKFNDFCSSVEDVEAVIKRGRELAAGTAQISHLTLRGDAEGLVRSEHRQFPS